MARKPRFRNVGAGKGVKEQLDRETLRGLYVGEGYTLAKIAGLYGCTPQFVSLLVHEYGLEGHSPRKQQKGSKPE